MWQLHHEKAGTTAPVVSSGLLFSWAQLLGLNRRVGWALDTRSFIVLEDACSKGSAPTQRQRCDLESWFHQRALMSLPLRAEWNSLLASGPGWKNEVPAKAYL